MSEERPGGYGRERPLEPREEPRLLAAILGSVGDAILVTEARSINEPGPRIVYANESFTRMTGYTAEELVGKTPRVLQGPLTDRSRLDEIRTALTRWESVRVDLLNYHKDGTQFWVEVNIAPLTDEHGNHTHWVSVQRDITERRRQQQALKESEERLRTILVQYASDIITILEPDGTIRYESPAVESVLGYEPQELVDENILDYIHPEDIEVVMREIGRGLEDTEVHGLVEARFRHKDGSWRYMEGVANNLIDDPAVCGVVINSREITERKKAEERLREAEERYRALVENVPAVVYIDDVDETNSVLYRSPFVREVLGYEPEEFLSDPHFWQNILHPEDRERVLAENDRTNETGEPFKIEYRMIRKDGRAVWIRDESVLIRDEEGTPKFWQGYFVDITKRKEFEERLEAAEERYRTLVEEVPAITYVASQKPGEPSVISYVSPQVETILGYSPREYAGGSGLWEAILHPEDRGRILAEDMRTGETGDVFREEFRMIARDGRAVWLREDSRIVQVEEDGTKVWHGIMFDITELKHAEARLRESEERYSSVVGSVREVVFQTDAEGCYTFLNPAWEEITGFTVEESVGKSYLEFIHPDDLQRNLEDFEKMGEHEGDYSAYEASFRAKDGSPRDIEIKFREHFDGEALTGTSGTLNDITERKETERALQESERRFRQLFEQSVDAMYVHDQEGNFVDCNSQACALLGYSREELLSLSVADISRNVLTEEERALKEEEEGGTLWQCVADGEPGEFSQGHEEENVRKDGTIVPVEVRVGSVDYGGQRMVLASVRDITERRRAQEALRESEERFRGAFENASTGVALVSLDNRYFRVNRAFCEMLGYSEEELVGKRSFDITHPEDQVKSRGRARRVLESGGSESTRLEKRYLKKDGGVVWAISDISLVRDSEGKPSHFVSHFQDITERKNLEEQLSYQALHDPLTGLSNRSSLQTRFERVAGHSVGGSTSNLTGSRDAARYVAVLFLDLDGFKEVNDSFGHAAGDELLCAVAGRLRNVIRPQDTVARLGGDEFCVLLAGVPDSAEAVRIAERLKTSVEAPFSIISTNDKPTTSPGNRSMAHLSTSIGIAVSEPGESGRSLDELLREADAAMYRAKKRGGALYEIVELTENTG